MDKEIYLLLDNIRSVYNVGSIFRTSEAIGVKKIFLSGISGVEKFGRVVKLNPKVSKTALEGINVPWEYCENPFGKLHELKSLGVQTISLELTNKSIDYTKANYKFPLCLIVGHEREGVNEEINNFTDLIIKIPMQGRGKSLNVSVATAVALFNIVNLP